MAFNNVKMKNLYNYLNYFRRDVHPPIKQWCVTHTHMAVCYRPIVQLCRCILLIPLWYTQDPGTCIIVIHYVLQRQGMTHISKAKSTTSLHKYWYSMAEVCGCNRPSNCQQISISGSQIPHFNQQYQVIPGSWRQSRDLVICVCKSL